jgi:hypothetical protein
MGGWAYDSISKDQQRWREFSFEIVATAFAKRKAEGKVSSTKHPHCKILHDTGVLCVHNVEACPKRRKGERDVVLQFVTDFRNKTGVC